MEGARGLDRLQDRDDIARRNAEAVEARHEIFECHACFNNSEFCIFACIDIEIGTGNDNSFTLFSKRS